MPFNTSNSDLSNIYSQIRAPKNITESTNTVPFHKFSTDYTSMYTGYNVATVLSEDFNTDLHNIQYFFGDSRVLCAEGKISSKLLKPVLKTLLKKLDSADAQELLQAAEKGISSFKAFINSNADKQVTQEIAGAPVNESANIVVLYELLGASNEVITEDAQQNRFAAFKKVLAKLGQETSDESIKKYIDKVSKYVADNYSTRGKLTPKQKQLPPPAKQGVKDLLPQKSQGLDVTRPEKGIIPRSGSQSHRSSRPMINVTPKAPKSGGFTTKVLKWMKDHKQLTSAAIFGVIAAMLIASKDDSLPETVVDVINSQGVVSGSAVNYPEVYTGVKKSDANQVDDSGDTGGNDSALPGSGMKEVDSKKDVNKLINRSTTSKHKSGARGGAADLQASGEKHAAKKIQKKGGKVKTDSAGRAFRR